MSWYESLDRSTQYTKNYRRWNLFYDFNNSKHHEMKRLRSLWVEHWMRRLFKHEAHLRFFLAVVGCPALFWINGFRKRFKAKPAEEDGNNYIYIN